MHCAGGRDAGRGFALDALAYYALPGPLSGLGARAAFARALPASLPELCRTVQGLVLHPFMTGLYGLAPDLARNNVELELRGAAEMLACALTLDPRPLAEPRAPERRLRGNCRHFTLLLSAILRARRAWQLVDAQLDGALQAREPGLRVPGVVQSAFLGGRSVKLAPGVAN